MLNTNASEIPSFMSKAQILGPIMHQRLSGDPHTKITLSKSLFIQKPFIIPIGDADGECITIEDFLDMVDARIQRELAYREEITQLKQDICDEFNKLCDGEIEEDFIKFVRDQRQRLINAVIDETKIEEKMIGEEFFNGMMNGFEEEVLEFNKFSETVHTILWKPLLTPFPTKLMGEMKKHMQELGNDKSRAKIDELVLKLVNHVKEHIKITDIKDGMFNSSEELGMRLNELAQNRQICNIELENINENEGLVMQFASKCLEKIKLTIKSTEFIKREIKFIYEGLCLEDQIEANDFEKSFEMIQRKVNVLKMGLGKGNLEDYEKISKKLSKFENITSLSLHLGGNEIGNEGIKLLFAALKELKHISTLKLDLWNNKIEDEGAIEISTALKELKNLEILTLHLKHNKIGDEGAIAISAALKCLKSLLTLNLWLQFNSVGQQGASALNRLTFDHPYWNIQIYFMFQRL